MNDFADFFSPILVKELRQGMRTKVFIGIFLVIQVFMIISVLVSLENGSDRTAVDGMFWTFIGAATLFAMPMRGLPALNSEIKGNTLELMMLTQLSAWRITAGKWMALFLQTLLVVCAVLPYVVVRYFLGGVNLVEELSLLGWMVLASALLSAVTVGLSPFMQTVIGRIGLGIGMLVLMQVVPSCIFASRMGGMGSSSVGLSASNWLLIAVLMGPLVILQFFEVGVGKIAPSAENHSSRKRLIVLALVGLAALLGHFFHQYGPLLALASILSAPVVLGACMEDTSKIPSLYRPFVRRNALGKLAGRLLYPGWATGLLFALVLGCFFFACALPSWKPDNEALCVLTTVAEALLAPLALVRFLFRKAKSIIPYYFGLQVLLLVLAILISASSSRSYSGSNLPVILKMLPTAGFFLNLWDHQPKDPVFPFSLAITIASIVLLLVISVREWRLIAQMEQEAAKLD
jgi:ABC-type transport system involved in multi-copper enzyme maturation permease subunit